MMNHLTSDFQSLNLIKPTYQNSRQRKDYLPKKKENTNIVLPIPQQVSETKTQFFSQIDSGAFKKYQEISQRMNRKRSQSFSTSNLNKYWTNNGLNGTSIFQSIVKKKERHKRRRRRFQITAIDLENQEEIERLRGELNETPTSRDQFKNFLTDLKEILSTDLNKGLEFFENKLNTLPKKLHSKVFLEFADYAKKENMIHKARNFFRNALQLNPCSFRTWLEFAKMEEEIGELERTKQILLCGNQFCQGNDNLLIKTVKHLEKMNLIDQARELLSNQSKKNTKVIEETTNSWRISLEYALFEARNGNLNKSRQIIDDLIQKFPKSSPIFYESAKLELKHGNRKRALELSKMGIESNPRYGPLWFTLFKCEEGNISNWVKLALENISKELIWKVHYENGKWHERFGNYLLSRFEYCQAILSCQKNLRWKIWLSGARSETLSGNYQNARKLLTKALEEVPRKNRVIVLIEMARLEEYLGDLPKARYIHKKAKRESKREWKVFLESILLEMRANQIDEAIKLAEEALTIYSCTGRLWSVYIQLMSHRGLKAQLDTFRKAVKRVPKSGEVWNEGARILLHPMSPFFNLKEARRFLNFAIEFTPQFGDSFIEYIRLEMLENGGNVKAMKKLKQNCINANPNYGLLFNYVKQKIPGFPNIKQIFKLTKKIIKQELSLHSQSYQNAIMTYQNRENLSTSSVKLVQQIPEKELIEEMSFSDNRNNPEDYVTGISQFNRMFRNTHYLSQEERRKIIFGMNLIS
ncbi:tpr-containing protein [Anaeramoeba flamelloides]|uniref:Tpr-containing protein n=1 Tax=Anaeramoeba flamelloides TaxID=1746091 RepID=A0ABQ8YFZ4_9EUKA|nr:tpr-containing protein [Anaeramoeba flamelloides]